MLALLLLLSQRNACFICEGMEKKVHRLVLMVEPELMERLKASMLRREVFSRSEVVRQLIDEALTREEAPPAAK
ncbi:hypothetical protein M2337_003476 [Sphingobium sp. B2D3A]|uniref:hypothetical protein n=1 Tax=unclassified Sphingobium TaxID=2611147 RepID=UPI0022241A22|nr:MULTISPECIES: hypothetical protein [unclassified Sphingobium]MCW2339186.1 hypothetical protein [Sphingobium sp. B2D3A]MCW2386870.1 hypothetical protein [Sphingobium sp. B2D3D]